MCTEVCLLRHSGKDAKELLLVTGFPQRCCLQTRLSLVLTQCLSISKGTEKGHELPQNQTLQSQGSEWDPEEEEHLLSWPDDSPAESTQVSMESRVLASHRVTVELCSGKQLLSSQVPNTRGTFTYWFTVSRVSFNSFSLGVNVFGNLGIRLFHWNTQVGIGMVAFMLPTWP